MMENGLLQMERDQSNTDIINSVFRAAHSIKGSAGMLGFSAISELTHRMETGLDGIRSGQYKPDHEILDAMLAAVDGVRTLLNEAEHGLPAVQEMINAIHQRLSRCLNEPQTTTKHPVVDEKKNVWNIRFIPDKDMFLRGNDPLQILRELQIMGSFEASPQWKHPLDFSALDPISACLGWDITLTGNISQQQINDVFSWVDEDCKLDITEIQKKKSLSGPDIPMTNSAETGEASIRVNVNRIDTLLDLLGELVTTQAMLKQIGSQSEPLDHERLRDGLELLERNTRNLQQAVIHVRMLPIDSVFMRFPRLVRDLSQKLGKQVRLRILGEGTELDRSLIEKITDPLVHLVRNAIDHGLETPDVRRTNNKDSTGTITLAASQQGGYIIIEVSDDGCGIDHKKIIEKAIERGIFIPDSPSDAQILELIFTPGFSTANTVTEVSGRGVGMDVVRRNIQALNGEIQLRSTPNQGTRVLIRLPLSLAILDGMIVESCEQVMVLPLSNVVETRQLNDKDIRMLTNGNRVLRIRDEYLPIFRFADKTMATIDCNQASPAPLAVVVEGGGQKIALEVDDLVCQQQVVVKNIETNYRHIDGISGATILGDGQVALIVDVCDIVRTRNIGKHMQTE